MADGAKDMAGVAGVVARRAAGVASAATFPGRAGKNAAGDGRFLASEGTRAANRAGNVAGPMKSENAPAARRTRVRRAFAVNDVLFGKHAPRLLDAETAGSGAAVSMNFPAWARESTLDPSLAANLLSCLAMRNLSTFLSVALAAVLPAARAGDGAAERREFHQSGKYPFVFRADSYLASTGPVPMRIAPAAPRCPERNAPPLTGPAKGADKQNSAATKAAADAAAANETAAAPVPAHPAPLNAAQPTPPEIDFSRVPDEVLDFFKNTEGRPVRRGYLFDPIFQPATPNELPKSKATYQQK